MSRPSDTDLPFLPLTDSAALVASRTISSVELTTLMLKRIEALDPELNAFITVTRDAALAQARAMDDLTAAGIALGPLHGVPLAIKDNIATAGIRTTAASRVYADWVPDRDATVVERLRSAGAVILGKLNLYELAFGGVHPDFGESRNPWKMDRACGASSSGPAAAVAAGLRFVRHQPVLLGVLVADLDAAAAAVGRLHALRRRDCRDDVEARFTATRMVADYDRLFARVVDEGPSAVIRSSSPGTSTKAKRTPESLTP